MDRHRKFLIIFSFVMIDVLLIGGFVFLRDVTLSSILKNEVNALVELDFTKDRFNTKIKSSGDYAVVEEAIKNYLDNYAIDVQDVGESVHDKTLNDLVLVDNIEADGPDFVNSLNYVADYRNEFNEKVDELIESSSTEELFNYIYEYSDDEEVISLYNDLINSSNFINEINDTKLLLELKKVEINSHFDAIVGVLEFLSTNRGNYYIENDEIKFISEELRVEYFYLYEKTQRNYD